MTWTIYFARAGGHVHCRVFVNSALAGQLCFRLTEWKQIGPRLQGAGAALINETVEDVGP